MSDSHPKYKTDDEVVEECNRLAKDLYAMMGYTVRAGYKMYEATHPQEVMSWNMAAHAYEVIAGTDVKNALAELGGGHDG